MHGALKDMILPFMILCFRPWSDLVCATPGFHAKLLSAKLLAAEIAREEQLASRVLLGFAPSYVGYGSDSDYELYSGYGSM
jgi:hypothetical protein